MSTATKKDPFAVAKAKLFLLRGASDRTYKVKYQTAQRHLVSGNAMGTFVPGTEVDGTLGPFRYQQTAERRILDLLSTPSVIPWSVEIVEYVNGVIAEPTNPSLGKLVLSTTEDKRR